jgi:hypothetical protein
MLELHCPGAAQWSKAVNLTLNVYLDGSWLPALTLAMSDGTTYQRNWVDLSATYPGPAKVATDVVTLVEVLNGLATVVTALPGDVGGQAAAAARLEEGVNVECTAYAKLLSDANTAPPHDPQVTKDAEAVIAEWRSLDQSFLPPPPAEDPWDAVEQGEDDVARAQQDLSELAQDVRQTEQSPSWYGGSSQALTVVEQEAALVQQDEVGSTLQSEYLLMQDLGPALVAVQDYASAAWETGSVMAGYAAVSDSEPRACTL